MKPIDYRNETWEQVQERMSHLRGEIWTAMLAEGGARTTRDWAELLDVDLLTLRPRITELQQLGFVECPHGHGGQGCYKAVSAYMARHAFDEQVKLVHAQQMELPLA